MKEQIHTIPINDALDNAGECLFCYIERRTEEHAMNFVLGHGASYMEADIRDMTDKAGFCRTHFKKMFDYGNSLGNAWILKTHYRRVIDEMNKEFKNFKPGKPAKKGLFAKPSDNACSNSIVSWIHEKECSCFICNSVQNTFEAYLKTFFTMYILRSCPGRRRDRRKPLYQAVGQCRGLLALRPLREPLPLPGEAGGAHGGDRGIFQEAVLTAYKGDPYVQRACEKAKANIRCGVQRAADPRNAGNACRLR